MSYKRGRASAQPHVLVILDMNGVLLVRSGSGKTAQFRPHLEHLLETLWGLGDSVAVAVWSSMLRRNLEPLVDRVFGDRAGDLAFVWDQDRCTRCRVQGMQKPLLRKDLSRLRTTPWASYAPDHVILVDDDPIKCTQNPTGTAVHPTSFTGVTDGDTELLRLAAYVEAVVSSSCASARQFLLSQPYDTFSEDDARAGPPAKRRRGAACDESDLQDAEAAASSELVEAFAEDWDAWFPARVVKVLRDGSLRVRWEGYDDADSVLPPESVRAAEARPARCWRRVESRRQPGVFYYHDEATGETQAEPPEPWELRESRTKAGVFYYWNRATGLTSTEKPDLSDDVE